MNDVGHGARAMAIEVYGRDQLVDVECDFCESPAWFLLIRERTSAGMKRCCRRHAARALVELL